MPLSAGHHFQACLFPQRRGLTNSWYCHHFGTASSTQCFCDRRHVVDFSQGGSSHLCYSASPDLRVEALLDPCIGRRVIQFNPTPSFTLRLGRTGQRRRVCFWVQRGMVLLRRKRAKGLQGFMIIPAFPLQTHVLDPLLGPGMCGIVVVPANVRMHQSTQERHFQGFAIAPSCRQQGCHRCTGSHSCTISYV